MASSSESINLGSVYASFEFRLDGLRTGVAAAKKELQGLESSVNKSGINWNNSLTKFGDKAMQVGDRLSSMGDTMNRKVTLPIVAGFGLAAKSAIEFEDNLANVKKTTGATDQELEKIGQTLLDMSKSTRTSVNELIDIATIGGQIGISAKDITKFTNAIDKMNVALGDEFTGGAEEVTNAIGGLRQIFTDIRSDKVDEDLLKIGNAINILGADGLATGPVVADFSSRIGGLTSALGNSAGNILGMSATLQELSVTAERGGTAVGKTFQLMAKDSEKFAKIAGMSAADFKKTVDTDINGAFIKVLEGVNKLNPSATELATILDELGLTGSGNVEVFQKLSKNLDLLKDKQKTATKALGETNSIMDEYNTKNNTSAAELAKMRNQIIANTKTIGDQLIPVILKVSEHVAKLTEWFSKLSIDQQQQIILFIGLVAAIGPVVKIIGTLITVVGAVVKGVGLLVNAIKAVQVAWVAFSALVSTNPLGLLLTALTTAVTLVTALTAAFTSNTAATEQQVTTQDLLTKSTTWLNDAKQRQKDLIGEIRDAELAATDAKLGLMYAQDQESEKQRILNDLMSRGITSGRQYEKATLELEAAKLRLNAAQDTVNKTSEEAAKKHEELMNMAWKEKMASEQVALTKLAEAGKYDEVNERLRALSKETLTYTDANGKMAKMTKEDSENMALFIGDNLSKMDTNYKNFWNRSGETVDQAIEGAKKRRELFNTVGNDYGKGLSNGMLNQKKNVYNSGFSLGNSANQGYKDALKIKSPSRVGMEGGGFFGEGIAIGISKSGKNVLAEVIAITDAMKGSLGFNSLVPPVLGSTLASGSKIPGLAGSFNANGGETNIYGDINIASEVDADNFLARLTRNNQLAQKGLTTT